MHTVLKISRICIYKQGTTIGSPKRHFILCKCVYVCIHGEPSDFLTRRQRRKNRYSGSRFPRAKGVPAAPGLSFCFLAFVFCPGTGFPLFRVTLLFFTPRTFRVAHLNFSRGFAFTIITFFFFYACIYRIYFFVPMFTFNETNFIEKKLHFSRYSNKKRQTFTMI